MLRILIILFIPFFACCQIKTETGSILFVKPDSAPKFDTDAFLPDTIFIAEGKSIVLYNDCVCYTPLFKYNKVQYEWSGAGETVSGGRQIVGSLGNTTVTLKVKYNAYTIDEATAVVSCKGVQNINANILAIGNSLTYQGWEYQRPYMQTYVNATLTSIGTNGNAPNTHEGYGGWTYESFITSGSPFFYAPNRIDISQYLTDNTLSTPDIVRISLGINDCWTHTDTATILSNSEILIDSILSHLPDVKIFVSLPTIGENTGYSYYQTYGNYSGYEEYILWLRSLWHGLDNKYDNGKHSWRVYVCYDGLVINRDAGYPKSKGSHVNTLHPTQIGHQQLSRGQINVMNEKY